MKTEIREKAKMYHAINDITLHGEIVIFGSTFMADYPFYELSKKYLLSSAVYNRSIRELTLEDADEILSECVLELKPSKIFLALGEMDVDSPSAITTYGKILKKIQTRLPLAKIYLLPVENPKNAPTVSAFNEKLHALCRRTGVTFLEVPDTNSSSVALYEKLFKRLHCFFRDNRLTFAEAFSLAE